MRKLSMMAVVLTCWVGGLNSAHGAEQQLGLRGHIYFDSAPASKLPQNTVPRHVASKHVARAPIDFSYPETAASTGTHLVHQEPRRPREENPWQLELSDGAKLRFAYDKDTKIKLGMSMWKVNVGVSKVFGSPSADAWELPERHGRAAALGRADRGEHGHPLN